MSDNRKVRSWMRDNACDHDNPTSLAEAAADVFDLYEDEIDFNIPEWVFEMSLEYKDVS